MAETDRDGDGLPDCDDLCPDDYYKTEPGVCDCGTSDKDSDGDGIPDCNDQSPGQRATATASFAPSATSSGGM